MFINLHFKISHGLIDVTGITGTFPFVDDGRNDPRSFQRAFIPEGLNEEESRCKFQKGLSTEVGHNRDFTV